MGLYWLSVHAYDPTLGRFLSHDPLGRVPLFFDASQPYAYGGNNPLTNVDPSGLFFSRQMFDGGNWKPHPLKGTTFKVQVRTGHVYHDHQNRYNISVPGKPTSNQHICDSTCQAMNDKAKSDLFWGIGKAVTGIAITVGGCVFSAFCPGYLRAMMPWILDGIHGILDALDIFYRYDWGGALASGWTLMIRSARVAIDIMQVVLLLDDIDFGKMWHELRAAAGFFQGVGKLIAAEFSKAPDANSIVGLVSSGFAIKDMLHDHAFDDYRELYEAASACVSPTAHCYGL